MEEKHLYLIVSSTPNRMGGFIRRITGAAYNHTCISLNPNLEIMYGFARHYYRTPFYGGFVLETPSRYCVNGVSAQIELYKIPVSPANYTALAEHLKQMYENRERYIYNHFSAWVYPLRWRIPAKDAYVCVEFCVEILQNAGIHVDIHKHYSIDDLRKLLHPYHSYTGPMPQNGKYDEVYFLRKPLPHPIFTSLCSMAALLLRIGQK